MALVLLLSGSAGYMGCSGYTLGSSLPAGLRSVYMPTFINECGEPLLETEATSATRAEIQRDGTLQLASDESMADTILNVTLTKIETEPVRYDSNKPKTTAEYRLKITATLTFQKKGGEKALLSRTVTGEKTFKSTGDLSSAKLAARPKAFEDLAHRIVEGIVEYW
jgi:hypothetical protein